jgi:hypothetical protein
MSLRGISLPPNEFLLGVTPLVLAFVVLVFLEETIEAVFPRGLGRFESLRLDLGDIASGLVIFLGEIMASR